MKLAVVIPAHNESRTLAEDLYLTLMAFDHQSGQATIRAMVTPAVAWLWIGGGIVIVGVWIAFLRRPRREESAS